MIYFLLKKTEREEQSFSVGKSPKLSGFTGALTEAFNTALPALCSSSFVQPLVKQSHS